MDDFADARRKMVDSQIRTENVTDHEVLAAMGSVPREIFVAPQQRALVYSDSDVLLKETPPRYLMRAAPLGRLLQLADVEPGNRALVVGAATGYSAAVLSHLAQSVIALESDPALAAQAIRNLADLATANVTVVVGPLEDGYPAGAPFDVILVDGAVETLPDALTAQLADGGRLVAIVGYGRTGTATLYTRSEGDIGRRSVFDAGVPPLPGFRKPEVFVF